MIVQDSEIEMVHMDATGDEPVALGLLDDEHTPLLKGREE